MIKTAIITATAFLAFVSTASAGFIRKPRQYEITVTNLAYRQPMSPFFVAVHNQDATPIFELGMPASPALATLAEEGDSADLVELYSGELSKGIHSASTKGDLLVLGTSSTFLVNATYDMRYLSMVSMAVNTNDCFVGFNAVPLIDGKQFYTPGYDAGSEENNELCSRIPGPACTDVAKEGPSGNGEGAVHVHRGIHGIGDLTQSVYDWRNPMLHVAVKQI